MAVISFIGRRVVSSARTVGDDIKITDWIPLRRQNTHSDKFSLRIHESDLEQD